VFAPPAKRNENSYNQGKALQVKKNRTVVVSESHLPHQLAACTRHDIEGVSGDASSSSFTIDVQR
jgi:hypothetical protein